MTHSRFLQLIVSFSLAYSSSAGEASLASEPKLELSLGVHSVPSTVPSVPLLELSVALHSESRAVPFAGKREELVLDVYFRNTGKYPHTFKIYGRPAGLDVTLCTSDGIQESYGSSGIDFFMPRASVTVAPTHTVRFGLRMINFNMRGPQVVLVKARWWHPNERRTVWAEPIRVVLLGPGGEKPRLTPAQEGRLRSVEKAIRAQMLENREIASSAPMTSEPVEHQTDDSNAGPARRYMAIGLASGAGCAVVGVAAWLLMRRKRRAA